MPQQIETNEPSSANSQQNAGNQPKTRTLTQEEYDALQENAGRFLMIANDPQLSQTVLDHFRAKSATVSRGSPKQVNSQQTQQREDTQVNPDTAAMQEMYRKQALLEVELFRMRNPDLDNYKTEMGALLSKYPNMSLEEAYKYSKQAKPPQAELKPKENTATPTTETNNSAGVQDSSDIETVTKKIEDRKATPRIDDAIDMAWEAAKAIHSKDDN
jgi:hypothetical protein